MARSSIISIKILGDAKGAITAASETESAFGRLDRSLGGVGGRLDTLGGTLNRWVRRGVLTGVGAAVGAVGLAIASGFSRLQAIDDAEGKLRGLGHTAEGIEKITDSALTSVRGTAFGLGDAATVAATAVAAGVRPGAELTRYLSLIADTSAIAGVGLSEVGSIINKMTTGQRVYTAELNQLADRGLPVFTWLQEAYGVSGEELRKMVSNGEVDTERFLEILETNIGGAALESGNTFRGAFANMRAALGRFGAQLIGPLFRQAQGWFKGITRWIDDLTKRVGPFADRLSEAFSAWTRRAAPTAAKWLERLRGWFDRLHKIGVQVVQWISDNREQLIKLAKAVGPAIAAVAGLAMVVNGVTHAFRLLAAATPLGMLIALVAGFIYAYQNSERFREIVDGVARWLRDVAGPIIGEVARWIVVQFEAMVGWVRENWPKIRETIAGVVEAVRIIVDKVISAIRVAWEMWGDTIVDFTVKRFGQIRDFIGAVLEVIRGIINTVTSLIRGDWQGVWNGIKTILSGVWDGIKLIVQAALDNVKLLISLAWQAVLRAASTTWTAVKNTVSGAWDAITGFVRGGVEDIVGFVVSLPRRIKDAVTGAFDAIWRQFAGVLNKIIGAWNSLRFTLPSFTFDWNGPLPGGNVTVGGWEIGTPYIDPIKLAKGAVVSSPMLAMVGEYAGARSNPEIVTPQRTMAEVFREELEAWSPTVQVFVGNEPVDARVKVAMAGVAGSVRQGRRG